MPRWNPLKVDFSGGAVDLRFAMRQDVERYQSAVLQMENWMPMVTGSARRTPGSRFVKDIGELTDTPKTLQEARIFPFLDAVNLRTLLVMTDEQITSLAGSLDFASGSQTANQKQVVINSEFVDGLEGWTFDPAWYTGGNGDQLGVRYATYQGEGAMQVQVRLWDFPQLESDTAFVRGVANVDVPTTKIRVDYRVIYENNFGGTATGKIANIRVGTSEGASDVAFIDLNNQEVGSINARDDLFFDIDNGNPYTGPLFIQFFLQATENRSAPLYFVDRIAIFANSDAVLEGVEETSPYKAEDLKDIHYVQSPHGNKEVFFFHRKYPPYWFYYDPNTDAYVMEPVPFDEVPGEWDVENYPSTGTAFEGRLFLGGVPSDPEIVWGSKVFEWDKLQIPTTDPAPDDPLKFVTTFRSPTRWMYGHKTLLVGALEMEYAVQSDGIALAPGDLAAFVQSSHGGANVQPVGFGQEVLFAAERGSRLRGLRLDRENVGWIAPDKSLVFSTGLSPGIKRLARMRNPHHMVVCLLKNGTLAILHEDTYAGISGWSILNLNSTVRDICVLADDEGRDVLFCVVDRQVGGQKFTYLEAFGDWIFGQSWNYQHSFIPFSFEEPTSTITGLEHLEGNRVQVTTRDGFVGTYLVQNGQIELEDQNGLKQTVSSAVVGVGNRSIMTTLPAIVPPQMGGAGTKKSYSSITVRSVVSGAPIINGQRPNERDPFAIMNKSQPLDFLYDYEVTNGGFDDYATITIEEDLPIRQEVIALFGTLVANEV